MKCKLQGAFLAEKNTCKCFSYVLYKIYYIKYDYSSFKLHSKSKLTVSFFLSNFLPFFFILLTITLIISLQLVGQAR